MARLLDYNPLTGVKTLFSYDNHADAMTITYEQDVSQVMTLSHEMAADTSYTQRGIKNDIWHYARIPTVAAMDMLHKHGVDIGKPEHRKRMFELLNTEYKYLKTTYKTHNER